MPAVRNLYAIIALGLATAGSAWAQPVSGPYVSLGGGANFLQDEKLRTAPYYSLSGDRLSFDTGAAALGAVGYGFGNGFRIEVEGNWRLNDFSSIGSFSNNTLVGGRQQNYGAMANLIFDMDIGQNWVYPYFGAGLGGAWTRWEKMGAVVAPYSPLAGDFYADGTQGHLAYQALFGLSFPVPYVPGLSLTAEYRFYSVAGHTAYDGVASSGATEIPARVGGNTDYNHSLTAGLRFELFPPPPPAPPAPAAVPAPVPPPAPEAARTYLVFFDWDRADLTDRGRQIVAEAAQASQHVQTTRIEVNGYTDLSGTAVYNQRLSVRRAESVEAELIRDGVTKNEIDIHGYGESNPLVPTAKGVREPQNRRVEIILK